MFEEKVSLCLIVKNEEDFLERCVSSVRDLVEEVIILDTGSSDKTLEIAHRLTDKVFVKEFSGDFSEMRNLAMSKAKNEWILFLDADEFLYPKEINKLKKMISDGIDKNVGGVKFYAYNFFNTGGWFTSHVLRLFRNNKGFHYERAVGERIEKSITDRGFDVIEPDILLTHIGYYKPREYRYRKMENYISIAEKQIEENSNDFLAYAYKGINLRNNGYLEEAYYFTEKAVRGNPNSFIIQSFFGSVARSVKKDSLAIQAYYEAEKLAPKKMKSIMKNNRGVIVMSQGKYEEAEKIFSEAYSGNPHLIHILLNLGLTKYFLGKFEEADICFKRVVERNPTFLNRSENSFFEADPFQAFTYETIYGYPGLRFFMEAVRDY